VTGRSRCPRSTEVGLRLGDSAVGDPRQTRVSDPGAPVPTASDGGGRVEEPD
jgi:hypothetical protein